MTLVFEDVNSEVLSKNFSILLSVADVDAEEHVDDSFVEILKLRFGRDFESEFVTILKLKFCQDFELYFYSKP